eukprot:1927923-Heterocapsa_arctica.AAC.1
MTRQSWKSERHVSASVPIGVAMGSGWAPGTAVSVVRGGPDGSICSLLAIGRPSVRQGCTG